MPDRMTSLSESIPHMPGVVEPSIFPTEPGLESRAADLLDAESRFYRGYSWCLNAYPTLREMIPHLRQELSRLDDFDRGWQRAEVMTNVFLLSSAIADTVDDHLHGERFDFSPMAVVPGIGPFLRAARLSLGTLQRTREWRLRSLHTWRHAWGQGILAFLKVFVVSGEPDQKTLRQATTRLTSLLAANLPAPLLRRRARVVAGFRNQDLTHFDILALGRRFTESFPDREQPVLAIGLRTAGSYFAPLLCALLAVEGYRDPESVTIRPIKSVSEVALGRWEAETLARSAKKGALAVLVDERFNLALRQGSDEKFHTRLKRVYEVRLTDPHGRAATRYILAKSVGWGWLGYHALIAGERLAAFVPPVLGLRDGILYTEWLPQDDDPRVGPDRGPWMEAAASYVAARVRFLSLAEDPSPDLARTNQHKGIDHLASVLARAYGGKAAAFLRRPRLRQELASQACPVPTLTDAKMRPQEWITGPRSPLKTDFEHHGQGKNELDIVDPAYDLAEAMLYLSLSEEEEARFVDRYITESGDTGVQNRLFLNKLLAGTATMSAVLTNLADGRLAHRAQEFNRHYIDAWNFLTVHTARVCGASCGRPAALRWHSPLVVMDIDGVLDKQIFGFPSTTAAGLRALSLLHAHDVAVAVNTARTLWEVKEYCRAYGFVGGVAEYGAVAWDAVGGREQVLVSSESLRQLETVTNALRQVPGVFLNEDYQYSIRAYTYQRGATVPLPTFLIRDRIAGLRADRLVFHQTYLDTAVLAKDVDKGRGLLALLELAGQRDGETIAIGDSEPDLAMFRVANRSFAPSHISCRSMARLLGCRIADRPYQAGLLGSVRSILHADGRRCDRCQEGGPIRLTEAGPLFEELLETADQGRGREPLPGVL